jgi:hypothetical protein
MCSDHNTVLCIDIVALFSKTDDNVSLKTAMAMHRFISPPWHGCQLEEKI